MLMSMDKVGLDRRRCMVFLVVVMGISAIPSVRAEITTEPPDRACLCAKTGVDGRTEGSESGNTHVMLPVGKCGRFIGGIEQNDGLTWYRIIYDEKTMWVAGKFLQSSAPSCCDFSENGCPTVISRADWGARPARSESDLTSNQPLEYVFIHHSATDICSSRSSCDESVRTLQNLHMDTKHWADLGCSFVIGGEGSIFEGRGWDLTGAHTLGYNDVSIGICLIGDFDHDTPTPAQLDATQALIDYGVFLSMLSMDYKLRGHNDVANTPCPGRKLYDVIKKWPHYLAPPENCADCRKTSSVFALSCTFLLLAFT